ncbi:MAG: ATP-binding protein [Candidatus Micrarchaeota archaeon]
MYLAREEEGRLAKMLGWREAVALIGPRRVGKTTLALRMLEMWKEKGGKGTYFDLESLGAPSTPAGLAKEINGIPAGGMVVLDEIQALEGWVKVVRQEAERKERRVLITGSSASLLSKEIASSLGGRAVPETVLALSFRDAKKWGVRSLRDYLEVGGYPECVLRPYDAPRLHKLYLELTVLRDVAARKGVREIKPLSDLALLLLSEPGKTISAKKTAYRLGISQPTFRSFVEALNDAYLVLSVPPYLRSPRERIVSDAKHYAYDTGLQKSVSISAQEDEGRRLENVVAIEFVRRGYSLSYFKGEEGECDFIAQKTGSETLAVQVWVGSGEIPEREWKGLESGMKVARAKGLVLSANKTDERRRNVETKAVEDWLLEPAL